jgi:hypothetical protein
VVLAEGGKGSTVEEALRSGALRGWRKTVLEATFYAWCASSGDGLALLVGSSGEGLEHL